MRLAKIIPTLSGQSLQVTADVFNFLNMLDKDWGINRETSGFEEANVLSLATSGPTYDTRGTANQDDDRAIYSIPTVFPPLRRAITVGSGSRWRIQLGGKYIF